MAITSGGGCKDPAPQKFFKPLRKPSPLLFPERRLFLDHLLEVGGNRRTKKEEEKKRMILTRNNPFDFDGDLKTIENEVRERNELKKQKLLEKT